VATRRRDLMWHGGAILDLAPVKKGKERCLALSVSTGTFTEFSRLCEEALYHRDSARFPRLAEFVGGPALPSSRPDAVGLWLEAPPGLTPTTDAPVTDIP